MPVLMGHLADGKVVLDDPAPPRLSGPVQVLIPDSAVRESESENWTALSQRAFDRVWDNPEDDVYNELLER